ncbi:MAG: nickel pincer cofactor biosynthesis protein LarB [Mogibacterium sp.]|nr:nickel pincer cofactor biosynthesis protein LarB [Mogibacterium sp.]
MNIESLQDILLATRNGEMSLEQAETEIQNMIKKEPYDDIGYAKVDLHRKFRQGVAEVIYGESKSAEQIKGIIESMLSHGQESIMITRLGAEKASVLAENFDFEYNEQARIALIGPKAAPGGMGRIVVVTAGTSDIPVAEEAAFTAEAMGNEVVRLYDVGVAGLHRLLSHLDDVMDASVIIAVAGMEGALASVVGGLVDCPVIAVPTSVGYGAAFEGMAALLAMLNSCASGVSVVNIDNGFGAGFLAGRMNHMNCKSKKSK